MKFSAPVEVWRQGLEDVAYHGLGVLPGPGNLVQIILGTLGAQEEQDQQAGNDQRCQKHVWQRQRGMLQHAKMPAVTGQTCSQVWKNCIKHHTMRAYQGTLLAVECKKFDNG